MRNRLRTVLSVLAVAAIALVLIVSPTAAAGGGVTQFSGDSKYAPDGECLAHPGSPPPTLKLSGDFVGCWYITDVESVLEPSGVYQERGTEVFDGCLADLTTCGTITTEYKFTAKLDENLVEIRGRCQHPMTGGTGDFEGITGRFDFKDDMSTLTFYYRGHYSLP